MSDRTMLMMCKFFSEENHADQFMAGKLYLNRISYFKKMEEKEDGRPDSTEAIAAWFQPHDVIMTLKSPLGEITIGKDDLAAPISMSFDSHNHFHLLCLYATYTTGFAVDGGRVTCPPDSIERLNEQLKIDPRCLNFGQHVVMIHKGPEFLTRLHDGARNAGYVPKSGLVNYYDDEVFHGHFESMDIPFRKQKRFSYQREYRVCLYPKDRGDNAITVDIGDLSDLCLKTKIKDENDLLQLQLKPILVAS